MLVCAERSTSDTSGGGLHVGALVGRASAKRSKTCVCVDPAHSPVTPGLLLICVRFKMPSAMNSSMLGSENRLTSGQS